MHYYSIQLTQWNLSYELIRAATSATCVCVCLSFSPFLESVNFTWLFVFFFLSFSLFSHHPTLIPSLTFTLLSFDFSFQCISMQPLVVYISLVIYTLSNVAISIWLSLWPSLPSYRKTEDISTYSTCILTWHSNGVESAASFRSVRWGIVPPRMVLIFHLAID